MRRRYVTLDVFTLKRFWGNPLAVVLDSQGLETTEMQTIAREFNYPETVFVLPASSGALRANLRIFTPAAELPFAGHPTVGAAVALARGGPKQQSFVVGEKVGPVSCEIVLRDADSGEASFVLPKLPEQVGALPKQSAITAALGIDSADVAGDFEGGEWSAGLPFMLVPLKDLNAIKKARPQPEHFEAAFARAGRAKVFLFCRETVDSNDFHARMFAPGMGIPEDPATGSAVAALGGLLAAQSGLADGTHRIRVEQGYEMGRLSQIDLTLTIAGGHLTSGRIGGGAIVVTEGVIEA
jgi:trans-2,3-dihydro-3-hydroxyanthranilate isomerase